VLLAAGAGIRPEKGAIMQAGAGDQARESAGKGRWPLKPIILLLAVGGLIAGSFFLPVGQHLERLLEWTKGLGPIGPVVVAGVYVVSCVLLVPGSILTLGAGVVFDVAVGTVTVSVGSTLGACAAFMVGRTFARGWIESKVASHEKFAAIDEAVGREGFKIVLLTRLSPIFPFNLLNYAYGLTKVPFWKYALASWVGMLPGTVMYVYLGAGLTSLAGAAAGREKSVQEHVFFWGGLAVTIAVAVIVTRVARKALRQAVGPQPTQQDTKEPPHHD